MRTLRTLFRTIREEVVDYVLDLPTTLKHDVRSVFTPRAELSGTGRTICLLITVIGLALGYTYLEATEEHTNVFPSWSELWMGTRTIIYDPFFDEWPLWEDSLASFERLFVAIGIAGVAGTILGLYMGVYSTPKSLFSRFLEIIGNIPASAMLVVFIAKFQFTLSMYVWVQLFGIITAVSTTIFTATQEVPNEEIYTLRTLGASRQEIIWSVLFKQLLPNILEAIRQSISPAIVFLIIAEWQAGSTGWGWRFMMMYRGSHMEQIFPYLIYFGLLAIVFKMIFQLLERWLCPWTLAKGGK